MLAVNMKSSPNDIVKINYYEIYLKEMCKIHESSQIATVGLLIILSILAIGMLQAGQGVFCRLFMIQPNDP